MGEAGQSGGHDPPQRPAPPGRWIALAILLTVLASPLLWLWRASAIEDARDGDGGALVGDGDRTSGTAAQDPSVARVRGVVLLEERAAPQPAAAIGETDDAAIDTDDAASDTDDAASDTDAFGPDTDGTTTGDPGAPRDPVATVSPPAGSCRIAAWRDGVSVATPVSCDAEGAFELVLAPGVYGRIAVEIEVPDRLRAVVEVELPAGAIGRLPTVALGFGERLGGTVVDTRGAPLPGVEITARPSPDLDEPEPWRARSDAAGRFDFDTLPPGPVVLRCEAAGYAPTVLEAIAPESDVQLVLDALYDLRGTVIGPADALARVRVRIEGSGVWPVREVAAAADGSFVLPQIPDGVYALAAIAPAATPGEPEYASIMLESVDPGAALTLALATAWRVPVRVLDERGEPVPGARVTLGSAHLGLLQLHERTAEDGRVAMGPVPSGQWVVRADADGMLPSEPVAVAIDEGHAEEIVLRVARPGVIAGVVVDEDDRVVADAFVEVESDAPFSFGEDDTRREVFERQRQSGGSLGVTTGAVPEIPTDAWGADVGAGELGARSDDAGRFRLESLAPGSYTLQAHHGRFAASDRVTVELGKGGVHEGVRLRLRSGHRLTGRVTDGNHRALAGATIELDDGSTYSSDWRGEFDAGLRRGSVTLVVRAPGLIAVSRTLEVRADVDLEIALEPAQARVRGHVVDDNHRPLPHVQVTLRSSSALAATQLTWSDERGQFGFDDLAPGEVELELEHPAHASVTAAATAREPGADRELEFVMTPGYTLVVDVRDAETGFAIVDAEVVAGDRRGRTDRRGVVRFDALADERLALVVRADAYGSDTQSIDRDGRDRVDVQVELREGGSVSGVVTDWAGEPVGGAKVVVVADGVEVAELRSDGRGRFRADGVPTGAIVLSAWPPVDREDDLAAVSQTSDVLRGRTTAGLDLRFERR